MRQKILFAAVLIALVIVACASVPRPGPPLRALGQVGPQPTLLASYTLNTHVGGYIQPNVAGMVYRPRTAAGPDTLTLPPNPSRAHYDLKDWLSLELNRPARVTVTPIRTRPAWTSDWTVDGRNYSRVFPAGHVALGAPGRLEAPYTVSLLEADGTPSAAPAVPDGEPVPVPNTTCPAWVHDQYTATGPDGRSYATWHPQVDPVYWCSFGHEHGSRPADGVTPLYGYTADRHGMAEPHKGFKTATIASGDQRWVITQHFGTGGVGRACTQFHTLDVALTVGGVLKADLHFMADFGKGQVTSGQTTSNITGCPVDQAAIASTGVRKINLTSNPGYEPWRADLSRLVNGFSSPGLSFDTEDAHTGCADTACTATVDRPGWGAAHHLTVNRPLVIRANGAASGVFYTDPMGRAVVDASAPGATRQYIEPGLSITGPSGTCSTADAWAGLMTCGGPLLSPDKVIERSILPGN